jgi:hypothetical protein
MAGIAIAATTERHRPEVREISRARTAHGNAALDHHRVDLTSHSAALRAGTRPRRGPRQGRALSSWVARISARLVVGHASRRCEVHQGEGEPDACR